MHITTLEEYGIRCALQLARHNKEVDGPALQASQIAKFEALSTEYVAKIMQIFRKEGLVRSLRGTQGGFILEKSPKDITLKDIMDSLKGKKEIAEEFCDKYTGNEKSCVHDCDCPLRPVWTTIFSYFDEILGAVTLNDLLMKEKDAQKYIQTLSLKKCKQVIQKIKNNEEVEV
jgi:Rrf2 family protein